MSVRSVSPFVALLLAGLGLVRPTAAQGDPVREIQEIARAIDEQLQEIDRLLLESGKKGQPRQKPKELLQQANEKSQSVEQGIDTLIEKLQQMKNQGGGGGGGQQQDQNQPKQDQQGQGQPQQQPGQGQRNRNENQTPDIADRPRNGEQPGEQPQGQQPGQQPQPGQQGQEQPLGPDGKPLGGQETKDGGRNTTGNRQIEPELGPANPGQGEGAWGELQPYMNFLKNRGSAPPQIPEKFRKYYEAWLKQNAGDGKSPPPASGPGGTRR